MRQSVDAASVVTCGPNQRPLCNALRAVRWLATFDLGVTACLVEKISAGVRLGSQVAALAAEQSSTQPDAPWIAQHGV